MDQARGKIDDCAPLFGIHQIEPDQFTSGPVCVWHKGRRGAAPRERPVGCQSQ